ncbi:hypothetical protein RIF29_25240 [Crotalaria pallida]|uniref:Ribosomal protein L18 n=1 Tax=Crotalaria pallida TaxID=3830 RepID=A0AAN9HXA7_CROPI
MLMYIPCACFKCSHVSKSYTYSVTFSRDSSSSLHSSNLLTFSLPLLGFGLLPPPSEGALAAETIAVDPLLPPALTALRRYNSAAASPNHHRRVLISKLGGVSVGCLRNMLKQAIGRIFRSSAYAYEGNRVSPWIYVPSCYIHSGQARMAPRSFFGVEDFLDDDNSRPYTYQKGKKSKNPNKHISFKQRTIAYMEPFTLDVFISKRFVSASLTHRVTSKQVAVAGTNSKDIKAVLRSRSDIPACIAIGRILAERSREADVYTASYTPRERDKFEGKIRAVVQSLIDNGIDVKVYLD